MTRDPWRPQDVTDAIRGENTRPGLPASLLLSQVPGDVGVRVPFGHTEVYFIQPNPGVMQLFIWPMDVGRRKH